MFLAVFATHGTAHIAWFDSRCVRFAAIRSRIVRFAPLSIPIYDEFAIGLYHLICALYFERHSQPPISTFVTRPSETDSPVGPKRS